MKHTLLPASPGLQPPEHSQVALNLLSLGKRDEALIHYEKAISINPSDPDLHYFKAKLLLDLDRKSEALASYEKSFELRISKLGTGVSAFSFDVIDTLRNIPCISSLTDEYHKLKEEVSFAIESNSQQLQIKQEMDEISKNQKLYNYYKAFCSTFSQSFLAYSVIASGFVERKKSESSVSAMVLKLGKQAPVMGMIMELYKEFIEKLDEVKFRNSAIRMASIAANGSTVDRMVENAARKVTLSKGKKEEILACEEATMMKFYTKVKGLVFADQYDKPEKKLALKDVSVLITACVSARIDGERRPEEIERQMVDMLVDSGFEKELKAKSRKKDQGMCLANVFKCS